MDLRHEQHNCLSEWFSHLIWSILLICLLRTSQKNLLLTIMYEISNQFQEYWRRLVTSSAQPVAKATVSLRLIISITYFMYLTFPKYLNHVYCPNEWALEDGRQQRHRRACVIIISLALRTISTLSLSHSLSFLMGSRQWLLRPSMGEVVGGVRASMRVDESCVCVKRWFRSVRHVLFELIFYA